MKAVNLIPNEQRGAGKPSGSPAAAPSSGGDAFGAYAVLGALVLAIGATALTVTTQNSINKQKSQLAQVDAQAQALSAQATSLQSFVDFKTLAATRVTTVRGIAAARFNWEQTMDDVSRALPSNVYLSSLDGTTTAGGGGSSLRGAISAPAIELTGCTTDQASVAHLMSSLRDVRGVTRVSLSSSIKPDTSTVVSAPSAPAATVEGKKVITPKTVSAACPQGDVPTFDVIAFFERSVLSSAASPNTSATGVTSAAIGPSGPTGPTGATGSAGATTPASSTTTTTTP